MPSFQMSWRCTVYLHCSDYYCTVANSRSEIMRPNTDRYLKAPRALRHRLAERCVERAPCFSLVQVGRFSDFRGYVCVPKKEYKMLVLSTTTIPKGHSPCPQPSLTTKPINEHLERVRYLRSFGLTGVEACRPDVHI